MSNAKSGRGLAPPALSSEQLDAALVAALAALSIEGDRAPTLGRIYDLTIDRIYSVAAHLLGDGPDAEEACADTYRQAWEHSDRYDPQRGCVLAWLLVIVHSRALDIHRRRRKRSEREWAHPDGAHATYRNCDDSTRVDPLESHIADREMRRALEDLAPLQRHMIGLAFFEGLSHQDIAARTGVPLGTVKSHIRRGLTALRRTLS